MNKYRQAFLYLESNDVETKAIKFSSISKLLIF